MLTALLVKMVRVYLSLPLLSQNVPLSTILPLTYLTVHFSSMNGSYHHVTARQRGSTHLLSTLSSMKHPISGDLYDLPNTVSKKQLLDVYDPVQVDPKRLVLLWDPDSEYRYEYTLKVRVCICVRVHACYSSFCIIGFWWEWHLRVVM